MKFAVSSQNWKTITRHGGKSRRWLLFEAEAGAEPREVGRLDLPEDETVHASHGAVHHPLFDMDVVLTGSCGEGFMRRMANQGVRTFATEEKDPVAAIKAWFAGTLVPAAPHEHHHH